MNATDYFGSRRIITTALLIAGFMMTGHASHAQEPHVHGAAALWLVLDGTQLEVEFHTPAMNVLGFEHKAQTDAERVRVKKAGEEMAAVERLFEFEPSTCRLIRQTSDFSAVAGDFATDTGSDKEDTHGHDGQEHLHDHVHLHAHEVDGIQHSNLQASYQFECENPDQLQRLVIGIPAVFSGVEVLHAQWVINGRQGSSQLNLDQREISFR